MIRDVYLKLIFIPLLGIFLPLISGLITYELYTIPGIILANVYFILTSLMIWFGCNWIHFKLRPLYTPIKSLPAKVGTVCFISGIYGCCIGLVSSLLWLSYSKEVFSWAAIYKFIAICVAAIILFTLVYEILFLTKEREIDTRIVDQLDRERSHAELQALANELDPHFIFNSLNTLNHLILNNPAQAHMFNNKLAQVYKYFLINKNRELIPLKEEIDFIEDYFFLLKIRHEGKLQLKIDIGLEDQEALLPPCAVQVLIENAIKHNEFTEGNPLTINLIMKGNHLYIINNAKPKLYSVGSTGIGLRNLSSRYRILVSKDIEIEKGRDHFSVKLPIIRNHPRTAG